MNLKRFFLYPLEFIFYNTIFKAFLWKKPKYNKTYRISLVGIFKNEARFLKEWIDYHQMIGIDHIFLYNNNSEDNYHEVLAPFIENKYVTLVDWPYDHAQMKAYKHCKENYGKDTQWMSFLDIDEFIVPRYKENLNDWIKDYERYPSIVIDWKLFGTGGVMSHDFKKLVIEQYTVCQEGFGRYRGKCIFNTDYDIAYWNEITHHVTCVNYPLFGFKFRVNPVNIFKQIPIAGIRLKLLDNYEKRSIQINHYWSKAWELYDEKRRMNDVFYKDNPKKNLKYFYDNELLCSSTDYTIFRFIMKLKIKISNIK